jgi:ADP-ribose pyrophosphatase YjhB (NUDIX family)
VSRTHLVFASIAVEQDGRLLLVQEAKPDVRTRWNLPGGHVEPGESIVAGATREVREETGLDVAPTHLLAVHGGHHWVWFVLRGAHADGKPTPGDEVMDARWWDHDAIAHLDDERLAHPEILRAASDRLQRNVAFPLAILA